MEHEVFYEQVMQELETQLKQQGKSVELERTQAKKVNEVLDGVVIKYKDSNVNPVIYFDSMVRDYERGDSIEHIVERTVRDLETLQKQSPEIPELNSEEAKKNLYCVIINAQANEALLKEIPHERVEDLAVIARFRVSDDGSFIVKNQHCEHFQMTSEEILEIAHRNTNQQGYTLQNMAEVMREMMIKDGMPEDFIDNVMAMTGEDCPMWVLSNTQKVDGAIAMTSKEALQNAYEVLGEDFYVLPSSRHEVLLVKGSLDDNPERLKTMVEEVNEKEVSISDKLSDNIYHYDGQKKKLSMVDTEVRSMSEEKVQEMTKSCARSR